MGTGQRQRDRKAQELQTEQQPDQTEEPTLANDYPVPDLSSLVELVQETGRGRELAQIRSCRLSDSNTFRLLAVFESAAYQSYRIDPRADHRITLVKLNVFRAFKRNIAALGYASGWMTDDALSRFSTHGPHPDSEDFPDATAIPASLRPTELQLKQPHHPWLDFFPFAQLRDNLIQHEDCMDDSQLCRDLMGFWNMPDEDNCMLVWSDPWDPMSWELTETFLKKWGWLVRGCPEILWSTNYWRRLRGERQLRWKPSYDREGVTRAVP